MAVHLEVFDTTWANVFLDLSLGLKKKLFDDKTKQSSRIELFGPHWQDLDYPGPLTRSTVLKDTGGLGGWDLVFSQASNQDGGKVVSQKKLETLLQESGDFTTERDK